MPPIHKRQRELNILYLLIILANGIGHKLSPRLFKVHFLQFTTNYIHDSHPCFFYLYLERTEGEVKNGDIYPFKYFRYVWVYRNVQESNVQSNNIVITENEATNKMLQRYCRHTRNEHRYSLYLSCLDNSQR